MLSIIGMAASAAGAVQRIMIGLVVTVKGVERQATPLTVASNGQMEVQRFARCVGGLNMGIERVLAGQPELTQQRIADESGVPLSVVSGLITNRVKRVDYGTLEKLCRYFKVQPGDLLVWEPMPEEVAA